jgi:hypothetical protein
MDEDRDRRFGVSRLPFPALLGKTRKNVESHEPEGP